jgi:hypothetical protein
MSISIQWEDAAHTIIRLHYQTSYTTEELRHITTEVFAMLNSVTHPVDVIVLQNPQVAPPRTGNMIAEFSYIARNMPRNLRLYINVGQGNAFSAALANLVLKLYRVSFEIKNVATLAEAHQYIAARARS